MAEKAHLALIAEANHIALRQFFRWFHQRLPARAVETLDQCRLDLRFSVAADTAATEPCRDHLGVVYHQLVAGLQPMRKIGNDAVEQDTIGLHDQHPRGIARTRGAQRDAAGWKFEIE